MQYVFIIFNPSANSFRTPPLSPTDPMLCPLFKKNPSSPISAGHLFLDLWPSLGVGQPTRSYTLKEK